MAVLWRMGDEAPPGVFHAPGNPDLVPGGGNPPPPPSFLAFGTTLFGQSYKRYKEPTLASGSPRYNALEDDTVSNVGGVSRKGSAVIRVYNDSGNGPGTWTDAHPSFIRADQPVVYSWKWPTSVTQATVKQDVRDFLDSKNATTTPFAWLVAWHEPDNDWAANEAVFTAWCNWQVWIREVLDEVAYAGRTDIRFGFITTGGPWNKSQAPMGTTGVKGWQYIVTTVSALRGGDDTWDFFGLDRYNPAWDGDTRYMPYSNWAYRVKQAFALYGKPFVVGETGSPRAVQTLGQTLAQRDAERADYITTMFNAMLADGFYDAVCWWRVPALSGFSSPFSTIMITPTGYNSTPNSPPDGTDAQAVVDVLADFCANSMLAANPTISFQP